VPNISTHIGAAAPRFYRTHRSRVTLPMKRSALLIATALAGCAAPASTPGGSPGPLPAPTVDELVAQSWRAAGVTPAPAASDLEFLRRVTLDLDGRIPTLAEAKAFIAEGTRDRRTRLVDRLLRSPEFAEHWADIYAELLFGSEPKAARFERKYDPASWLVRAFDENRPWNRVAGELLTASGDVRDNGAVAFIASRLRGGGGPEAIAGSVARIFLGLQIQCAQCHDHPYDPRWKQEDFYGLVAYFSRTRSKQEPVPPGMGMGPDMNGTETSMLRPSKNKPDKTVLLFDAPKGEAKMHRPHSEVDVTVKPRFLGYEVTARPEESRRQTVARAILGSDLFAKAMVARTWAQLFGHGMPEPWDDLGGEQDDRHPATLRLLAADFAASGYDVKRLVRTMVLSEPYGRASVRGGADDDASLRTFARSGVRPLAPEPLFRSLVVATGADAIARPGSRRLAQAFKEYRFTFGDDEMAEADRFDGSVPQSLLLFNGELTNAGSRADRGGVLTQILDASADPAARLEDMFLAVYTRPPRDDERRRLLGYLQEQKNARPAYEDVFFALLTSTEAITNH
jgi:hypothetical protein